MLRLVVTTARKPGPGAEHEAGEWAARLGTRFVRRADRAIGALCRAEQADGALVISAVRPPTYLSADGSISYFYHPGMALTRIKHLQQGLGDPMVRAMELQEGDRVLDCTLGRAADAIVASHAVGPSGKVVGLESSPLIAELTIHGLRTYCPPNKLAEAAMRAIEASQADHLPYLEACPSGAFDVVYFDPLFSAPVEASSAMQPLRPLADHRPLDLAAVAEAQRVAARCVVLKERPRAPLWSTLSVGRFVGGKGSTTVYGVLWTPRVGRGTSPRVGRATSPVKCASEVHAMATRAIAIDPRDDVAVVVTDVKAGDTLEVQSSAGAQTLTARQDIPAGHKIALRDLSVGAPILKYGEKIGLALTDIHPGDHVHIHNLASDRVKAG